MGGSRAGGSLLFAGGKSFLFSLVNHLVTGLHTQTNRVSKAVVSVIILYLIKSIQRLFLLFITCLWHSPTCPFHKTRHKQAKQWMDLKVTAVASRPLAKQNSGRRCSP